MKEENAHSAAAGGLIATLLGVAIWLIYGRADNEASSQESKPDQAALVQATQRSASATKIIAFAAVATLFAAIVQGVIFNRQLGVMQRQLNDSEVMEAASITLRNLSISGFPDNPVLSLDVNNSGRTRADQVTVISGFNWEPGHNASDLINRTFRHSPGPKSPE